MQVALNQDQARALRKVITFARDEQQIVHIPDDVADQMTALNSRLNGWAQDTLDVVDSEISVIIGSINVMNNEVCAIFHTCPVDEVEFEALREVHCDIAKGLARTGNQNAIKFCAAEGLDY